MKLDHPILYKFAALLGTTATRAWMDTLDYRVVFYDPDVDPASPRCRGQKIYVFWHEYILFPFAMRGNCNLAMLLSRHRDAEVLSYAARHMGFEFVRGSTNRGGVAALRQLLDKSQHMHLAITPDGPRGPRRQLAAGPVYLASKLGIPLVAMGVGYDRPWRVRSWDRFAIPRPCSRARCILSPEVHVPPDLDRDGQEHFRVKIEQLLNRLCDDSERWAESGSRKPGQLTPHATTRPLWLRQSARLAGTGEEWTFERTHIMTAYDLFANLPDDSPPPPPKATKPTAPPVLTVAEFTFQIKNLLENSFDSVWVAGEVSNLSRPHSGHCYLTLKDDEAQIRCALWRNTLNRLRFDLDDGLEVVCRGRLDVYAPRGTYQLIIESIEPKGIGALELALRQLREKLAREGLFDADRKRPLPAFVRHIAVVTSPSGAAIHDFLQVLGRRWRGADVLIVPTRVQGEGAALEIAAAIAAANRLPLEIDCLVVTRGGGSLEDLWCFNEEAVVRAIHASRIPVISAIGHEIDVTLSDLVADVRALTPSEAAELVAPAAEDLIARFRQLERRLSAALRWRLTAARTRLESAAAHRSFRLPFSRIEDLALRLDELDIRATRALRQRLSAARIQVQQQAGRLEALSPLGVLSRGYSLTQHAEDGQIVRDAAELAPGDMISTRSASGHAISRVEFVEP